MIYLIGGRADREVGSGELAVQTTRCRLDIDRRDPDVVNAANPTPAFVGSVELDVIVDQAERFYPMLEQLARCMFTIAGEYAIEESSSSRDMRRDCNRHFRFEPSSWGGRA